MINTYNNHVNVGNFTGAAALTFTDNVTYIIPGPPVACPYCATYNGKAAVISLFVDGFLGHFTILNPLVNLREITTDNGGPGGVPELMDFNGNVGFIGRKTHIIIKMRHSEFCHNTVVAISASMLFTV